MGRKAIFRFILAFCLALAGLTVLLGLLGNAQKQVYAASSQPMGEEAALRLAPPPGPARAPAADPPLAPLSQGGGGPDVVTVCLESICEPYTNVQAAVIAVAPGGIVKVAQGVYTDTNDDGMVVEITKALTLQGGYTTTNDWTTFNPEAYPTELNGLGTARVISIAAGISPLVEGFHIYNGEADRGGGVYVSGGSPTLQRNRIHGNTASQEGGGIYIAAGSAVVQNNLIYLNQGGDGGGAYVASQTPRLQHNTFYSNTASDNGGGICVATGSGPVISGTILVSNSASSGGGIYAPGGSNPIPGYNDVWGSENTGGNYVGEGITAIFTSTNPLFEDPAGGDFRLRPGSPCIDQVPVAQTVGLDYEGRARPFGEKSDIGAHEFYTGACFARLAGGRVYTTVQAAVDAASGGDLIEVAGYCAGVEVRNNLSQTVYISQGLTLRGGYTVTNWSDPSTTDVASASEQAPDRDAYTTTLDAEGLGRVVYVNSAEAVVVEGFHVYNGLITGTTTNDNGGGFYLDGAAHVVRYNEIYSNAANSSGGGVYISSNSGAHVYGNEIYSNTAGGADLQHIGGGGIYVGHASALVYDNTVHSNHSTGGDDGGGGICVRAGATVRDNVVYGNQAVDAGDSGAGGGIYVHKAAATVRANTVYENTAGDYGGGIYIFSESSGAVVERNTIYGNTANCSTGDECGGGICTIGGTNIGSGPTIQYNTVSSNTASGKDGGGIFVGNYSLIQRNTIYNNSAGRGGGIAESGTVPAVVRRNRIYSNSASEGGGLFSNTRITIENNLIYSNTADSGIYLKRAALIQNNTIYGNTGDGIHRSWGEGDYVPIVRNNIIVSNTGYGIRVGTLGSPPVTATYCNVWGNASGGYDGNAFIGTGTITENPRLVNPSVDFRLQADSPCRDAADPDNYPDEDFAGYARYFGSAPDMGAYEYYTGTCFARIGDAGQVYTSVQTAVYTAPAGAEVRVAGVCQEPFTLTVGSDTFTQTVYISQPLVLHGGYTVTGWTSPTAQTVLDAGGQGRAVYITGTGAVTVDGFIIRGGHAITGGGLYIATPLNPTIQNIVFYSNSAEYGGGFGSAGGNPRLYNNTFVSNTATVTGGGLHIGAGSPAISNSIVVSNAGGSLFTAEPVTLHYCDVWGNGGCDWCANVFTGTESFSADPLFVDPAGCDFHLQADSPCVHRGDPGTGLTLDFEGDERPLGRGYDVGADESTIYPDVDFGPPESTLPGVPGEQVVHAHFLTNTGSVSATFDLTYTLAFSGGTGWDADCATVFALAAGERAQVPVTVSVPTGAVSDTYATVVITAAWRVNPGAVYDVVGNTTLVNWNPGVELTPAYTEHVNPGTVMTYVHTLANTGNASDTFRIAYSSSYDWSVVTPTQDVALGPGVTTTLWVSVNVPGTAPGGLVETVVVTASSVNPLSGVSAVVTDTIEVNHTPGDRYVDDTGNDTLNNCLVSGSPCRTIVHAVGQAVSGDVVKVAEGAYSEHDISLNKNITLRGGHSPGYTVFDPEVYPTVVDGGGAGRVFYIFGTPTIEGFTIRGGATAGSGGGIYIYSLGSPILRRNVITGNTAGVYGGGVYNKLGNPTLEQNALAFNTAQWGAGFANDAGNPGFWSNTVYDNIASADGGGVYIAGGSPRIWHDTIYNNTADRGGGLYLAGGSPVVSNTIVAENTAVITGGGVYSQAAGAALDYNDVWNNTNGNYVGATHGPNSIFPAEDPDFVNKASRNFHLWFGSPCINKGGETSVAEDFEGQPRTLGPAPDIGADERRRFGVELESNDAQSGNPDTTMTYNHTVTNTGNYTDTIKFEAHSSEGWEVTLPSNQDLGSGESVKVSVQIKIPEDAIAGVVDTTVITAKSLTYEPESDTVVDTTTVNRTYGVSWKG